MSAKVEALELALERSKAQLADVESNAHLNRGLTTGPQAISIANVFFKHTYIYVYIRIYVYTRVLVLGLSTIMYFRHTLASRFSTIDDRYS